MYERDYIKITGLKIFAYHGVFDDEKRDGQDFYINAKLYVNLRTPGKSDALTDSLHYGEACHFMQQVFTEKNFDLIEAAGEYLCERLLKEYAELEAVELEIEKPSAPIGLPFTNVSVTLHRAWHKVYLAVGSNMGDSRAIIEDAIRKLEEHPQMRRVRASDLIVTKPYGPVKQDDFLNGAIELETMLLPEELLEELHVIEAEANRVREIHWGPRTLDLDILFYDNLVYESDTLIIPHTDMPNRTFVLEPLAQLCPNKRHPIFGETVAQMLMEVTNESNII